MLNLLIISNNSQAWRIQEFIRRLININVDVVSDFALGQEAILEKRPVAVIIQERIWKVGAESVVRNIQGSLGAGAPSFLLLHDSNPMARPARGLFEYAIDMNLSEPLLTRETLLSLKRICGDGWNMIATEQAMQLLGDKKNKTTQDNLSEPPGFPGQAPPPVAPAQLRTFTQNCSEHSVSSANPATDVFSPKTAIEFNPGLELTSVTPAPVHATGQILTDDVIPTNTQKMEVSSAASAVEFDFPDADVTQDRGVFDADNQIIGESQRVSSCFRRPQFMAGLALAITAVATGYLIWHYPGLIPTSLKSHPSPEKNAAVPLASTPQNKPLSGASRPVLSQPRLLPSFVSPQGRDYSFSTGRPGWERYLDDNREVRIFRVSGQIAAVQVLTRHGREITDSFLKSALRELMGNSEFATVSYEQRERGVIQRCRVGRKADLLLYHRTNRTGAVVAFVMVFDDRAAPGPARVDTRQTRSQSLVAH